MQDWLLVNTSRAAVQEQIEYGGQIFLKILSRIYLAIYS